MCVSLWLASFVKWMPLIQAFQPYTRQTWLSPPSTKSKLPRAPKSLNVTARENKDDTAADKSRFQRAVRRDAVKGPLSNRTRPRQSETGADFHISYLKAAWWHNCSASTEEIEQAHWFNTASVKYVMFLLAVCESHTDCWCLDRVNCTRLFLRVVYFSVYNKQ